MSTTYLPSLSALLPSPAHTLFLARLSLQALHIESYSVREDVYVATTAVIPGQIRSVRLRAQRKRKRGPASHEHEEDGDEDEDEYSVEYLSPPLSGREHADMAVRACLGLDVVGGSSRGEVEAFIRNLGFRGTLHVLITRISHSQAPPSAPADTATATPAPSFAIDTSSEPYLVQLQPGRPVQSIASATAGAGSGLGAGASVAGMKELGLQDTMALLQEVSGRIEGVKWETGR